MDTEQFHADYLMVGGGAMDTEQFHADYLMVGGGPCHGHRAVPRRLFNGGWWAAHPLALMARAAQLSRPPPCGVNQFHTAIARGVSGQVRERAAGAPGLSTCRPAVPAFRAGVLLPALHPAGAGWCAAAHGAGGADARGGGLQSDAMNECLPNSTTNLLGAPTPPPAPAGAERRAAVPGAGGADARGGGLQRRGGQVHGGVRPGRGAAQGGADGDVMGRCVWPAFALGVRRTCTLCAVVARNVQVASRMDEQAAVRYR